MASIEREIENLLYLYAERLDLGDIDGMARLFERAELLGPEGESQGRGAEVIAAIYKKFVRLYPDGTPRTQHVTSNIIISVDEERGRANSRSYFTVFQATDEMLLQAIIAGRYEDEFRRFEGEWHFHSRKIIPRLLGELAHHQHLPFG